MIDSKTAALWAEYREYAPARKGDWMQTFSGRPYWTSDPRPEDIFIEDVAHALAMMCRYTGACRDHYSIAEHSVHVSYLVPRLLAFQGLMHDGPEYVLNDMNRPTKLELPDYQALEDLNWRVFARRFGLPYALDPLIKKMDTAICFAEKAAILNPSHLPWGDWGVTEVPDVPDVKIECWDWRTAEKKFLERFYELNWGKSNG